MTTPTLQSIAIFVHDIERAIPFYSDVLEFPLIKRGSFGAEFFDGDAHLSVHPAVHPESKALVGRHTGITVRVEGILDYCARLHERGVRFLTEPTKQSWGVMAMIADPDGNVFAVWDDKVPDEE